MKIHFLAMLMFCCNLIAFSQTSSLNRINDPVVVNGAQLTSLTTLQPSQIVGFKFTGSWVQIPIQIDERSLLDIVSPYGPLAVGSGIPPSPTNPKILFYCDANTYIGNDSNPLFDNDDELVFMVKDAGGIGDGTSPMAMSIYSSKMARCNKMPDKIM